MLDGEGIFESLHAGFQILDFSHLLFYEEVLNSIQPYLDPLDILFAGCAFEPFVDHAGQIVNGCCCHMYTSIAGRRGVSMAGVGRGAVALLPGVVRASCARPAALQATINIPRRAGGSRDNAQK